MLSESLVNFSFVFSISSLSAGPASFKELYRDPTTPVIPTKAPAATPIGPGIIIIAVPAIEAASDIPLKAVFVFFISSGSMPPAIFIAMPPPIPATMPFFLMLSVLSARALAAASLSEVSLNSLSHADLDFVSPSIVICCSGAITFPLSSIEYPSASNLATSLVNSFFSSSLAILLAAALPSLVVRSPRIK